MLDLDEWVLERDFKTTFFRINRWLWTQFDQGKIDKYEIRASRFQMTLEALSIGTPDLARKLQQAFMEKCPQQSGTFPGTHEVIQTLGKHCDLHIITNGFEDIQHIKLRSAGLSQYFQHIITSESAGAQKPESKIFQHALALTGADAERCVMIGDNLVADVQGAIAAGLDGIHFNPTAPDTQQREPNEIRDLAELPQLLL